MALALLTAFYYVAIYTPLKRLTSLATFIGAFPGAMGPLLGWTAARPHIEWPAVALFAILFVWQFPHFMAISWLYRDDYARAGIRMLPVVQPDGWSTVAEALFFAVAMIPVSLAPWFLGITNKSTLSWPFCWAFFTSPIPSASPASSAPRMRPRAACWRATFSKSASFTCPCYSPRSCSAPTKSTKESETMTDRRRSPSSTRPAIAAILLISAAATLFLFWLIYVHPAAASSTQYAFLPALNALLNGLSATALLIGYTFIRSRRIQAHRSAMITAFLFSTLFLLSYIAHHALHGDVRYPLHAALRSVYLPLLASHIVLAIVALPLVLVTFFFSLTGRIPQHRKIARWTFPLWLYVSVTGVITYVMLRLAQG